ncbi:hypothetical protein [Microbulbifer epialgicus]|uniref:Uncharacterized protein n=1 Tax=Microbulbifer epialgicus TaxID=393907 RepID=A0ABV4P6I4_9GAMM
MCPKIGGGQHIIEVWAAYGKADKEIRTHFVQVKQLAKDVGACCVQYLDGIAST